MSKPRCSWIFFIKKEEKEIKNYWSPEAPQTFDVLGFHSTLRDNRCHALWLPHTFCACCYVWGVPCLRSSASLTSSQKMCFPRDVLRQQVSQKWWTGRRTWCLGPICWQGWLQRHPFSGVPVVVRSVPGSEYPCWQSCSGMWAPGSQSMLWGKAGPADAFLGHFCGIISGLDLRSSTSNLLLWPSHCFVSYPISFLLNQLKAAAVAYH